MAVITNSKDIANGFNDFFVSIGPELAKDIHSDINPLTYVNSVNNSIVNFDVSCDEVKNIIHSLKNSSAGHDEFPTFVGKLCVDSYIEILGPLLFIISVNDICNVSPMLFKILYADDTCVLISGNHLSNLIGRLNKELISLNNCLKTLDAYY